MTTEAGPAAADPEWVPPLCPTCAAGIVDGQRAWKCGQTYEGWRLKTPHPAPRRERRALGWRGVTVVGALVVLVILTLPTVLTAVAGDTLDHTVATNAPEYGYTITVDNEADRDVAYRIMIDGETACEGILQDRWIGGDRGTCRVAIPYDGEAHDLVLRIDYGAGAARTHADTFSGATLGLVINEFGAVAVPQA